MKEVANALVVNAEKSVLISIIKNILDNEENYDDYLEKYVISKCIGKPQITIVDVDLEKVNKYAEEYLTNDYSTLVEGSVKLFKVNPVKCTVTISYKYTDNNDSDKKVHTTTYNIDTQYYDVLKDE